ncbi:YwiC-like family protein [Streptomyces sp. MNU89]|uniref:YwiC-like family protein n=1 Tax=Streptomyces sp. MNU89 TaxID=2560025 RepID=UPI001E4CA10F|nr:YwiC-like family protein [Streptomyces sp. MNU89]MCC9741829.1 YwiC-like family protein [Streptomyces sp. MNU89]
MPPQHGAWAMLLLPYLAGLLSAGFAWPELPLLVAWIGGYLLSYFALLAVKTRRPARYRDQLLAYGLTTLAAGAVVLAARPQLILYAPVFALALAVNGFFASRRDDRALVNGLVSAAAATLILPVVVSVAGGSPWDVGGPFTVVLLYLAGTVLFVKSCIRERGNTAMFAASAAFHAAALAVAAWITPVYAVAFGWYLVRAAGLPRRRMTPLQLGLVEIVSSLLLLVSVALAA